MTLPVFLFEDSQVENLYPLTLTRPVFDLRCGIFTLAEKIKNQFPGSSFYYWYRNYLKEIIDERYPLFSKKELDFSSCLFINGRILFEKGIKEKINLNQEALYFTNGQCVAAYLQGRRVQQMLEMIKNFQTPDFTDLAKKELKARFINYPWDLVHHNSEQIALDFLQMNVSGRILGEVSSHAVLLNKSEIYLGEGSTIKAGAILDAERGPIYIGSDVTVLPNAVIEGPAFVGDRTIIKIGAKIYEGTSIGEVCKVGGEVEESIIHAFSNKQHEGFLGHSYLGEWVNIGADTNNSDLKNNYSTVKVYIKGQLIDSGSLFVGLFMGDHSKSGINTMFNTGTVVGVMSNVFGAGYPPKYIPSFTWGGAEALVEHNFDKAIDTARKVMSRRKVEFTDAHKRFYRHIFEMTRDERNKLIA